jgi:holin-like protein
MKNIFYTLFAISLSLALGKLANFVFGGLPASLYGMVIYCLLLQLNWLNPMRVKNTNHWLIKNMGVCFVPASIGIINHFDLIQQHGIALVGIIFISTFVLLTLVALLSERYLLTSNSLKQ